MEEGPGLKNTQHKTIGLLIVALMLSGVLPASLFLPARGAPVDNFALSQFTWQTFNRNMNVTTFVSPDGSRDELWHFLSSAKESILVEIYGVNNPYILDLIHELHAAKPGLEMKFLLGWNSLGYYSPNDYVANNLTLLGFPVKWTNDAEFTFAHQKFVIIDNKTTVVQAGNWAKTSFPEDGKRANREWSIAMTDTVVTDYYRDVFDYDWGNGIDYNSTEHGTGSPLSYNQTGSSYPRPFSQPGHFSGPMNVTPIFSPDTSLQGILYCINSAQATLDIQIPYFTSVGDAGEVDQVIDAIIAAKNRGVTVRVITEEGAKPDVEVVAEEFRTHGIPVVYQYETWFQAQHNKGIIVDGRIVLISSINYSDGSIGDNREAGVIIENENVAQWYLEVYDYDSALGDAGNGDHINVYWEPNIPNSESEINVTVFAHMLFPDIDEVSLGVKIGSGQWTNHTITSNFYNTTQNYQETTANYFYVISPQVDGTNITVQASVRNGTNWHLGMEMVIRVRNSIGSIITTTTTTTTTTDGNPLMEFLAEYGLYIAGAVGVVILVVVFSRRR